jgi:hypothetical protein
MLVYSDLGECCLHVNMDVPKCGTDTSSAEPNRPHPPAHTHMHVCTKHTAVHLKADTNVHIHANTHAQGHVHVCTAHLHAYTCDHMSPHAHTQAHICACCSFGQS